MHRKRSRGRTARTYIDQLMDDTQLDKEELPFAMGDRDGWKQEYYIIQFLYNILGGSGRDKSWMLVDPMTMIITSWAVIFFLNLQSFHSQFP